MATLPTNVPEDLEFPSRGESYSTFNTKANLFAQRLAQEVAPTINENAAFVNDQTAAAAQSEANAQASADASAASAALATASASYAGEWSSLSGSLSIPASVSHNRSLWVLATNLADVTLSEPGSLNSDWIEMPSIIKQVAIANNVPVGKVNYLAALLTLSGEQYLYDAASETTYYSPVALTGTLSNVGTDVNGVRTVTVGGSPYTIEDCVDYGKVTDTTADGATQVKHRRGTAAEIAAGVPAIGELWFNTTDNTIHMGDGVTQGGIKQSPVFDSVSVMKTNPLVAGMVVETKSYQGSSAKDTTGSAKYKIVTAVEYDGTPDEFGDHTLDNGNIAKLVSDVINIDQFGAVGDYYLSDGTVNPTPTDNSDSIQAAIYKAESRNVTSNEVYAPGAGYLISRPMLIYAADGLRIRGASKIGTAFVMSGLMTPVLDAQFQDIVDNTRDPYSYGANPCAFMVAATRRTGQGDWTNVQFDKAQWFVQFENFSVLVDNTVVPRSIPAIYAPEFAHGFISNIFTKNTQCLIKAVDFYRTVLLQCDCVNVGEPILHVNEDGRLATGTSLAVIGCGVAGAEKGWALKKCHYTSFISTSCDNWATFQPNGGDVIFSYAYRFEDCTGVSLIGCGAEDADTSGLKMKGLFDFQGTTCSVKVQGGSFAIADTPSLTNLSLSRFDAANVEINADYISLNNQFTKAPTIEVLSGDIRFSTVNQTVSLSSLLDLSGAASTTKLTFPNGKGNYISAKNTNSVPLGNNVTQVVDFGVNCGPVDNRFDSYDGAGTFTAPFSGTFLICPSITIQGAGVNYITIRFNNGSFTQQQFYDIADAGYKHYSPSFKVQLDKGTTVDVAIRTASGATGNIINAQWSVAQDN